MSHCCIITDEITQIIRKSDCGAWLRVSSLSADVTYSVCYVLRDNQRSEELGVGKPKLSVLGKYI